MRTLQKIARIHNFHHKRAAGAAAAAPATLDGHAVHLTPAAATKQRKSTQRQDIKSAAARLYASRFHRVVMDEAHSKGADKSEMAAAFNHTRACFTWHMTATPKTQTQEQVQSPGAGVSAMWRSTYSQSYPPPLPPASHHLLVHALCPVTDFYLRRRLDNKDQLHSKTTDRHGRIKVKQTAQATSAWVTASVIHPFIGWIAPGIGVKEFAEECDFRSLVRDVMFQIGEELEKQHKVVLQQTLLAVRGLATNIATTKMKAQQVRDAYAEIVRLCARALSWAHAARPGAPMPADAFYPSAGDASQHMLSRLLLQQNQLQADDVPLFSDLVAQPRQELGCSIVPVEFHTEMALWAIALHAAIECHNQRPPDGLTDAEASGAASSGADPPELPCVVAPTVPCIAAAGRPCPRGVSAPR